MVRIYHMSKPTIKESPVYANRTEVTSFGTPGWGQKQSQSNSASFTTGGSSSTWFKDGSGNSRIEAKEIPGFYHDSRAVIHYQSITLQTEYKNYSNEDLRLQDCLSDRIFGKNPYMFSHRPNNGTKIFSFIEVEKKDTYDNEIILHQSCVAMPQYRGYSQEELCLEDYRQGNRFHCDNYGPSQLDNGFNSFNANTSTFGSASRPCYEINLNFDATPNFFSSGNMPGFGNKFPGRCLNVFGPGSMPNSNYPYSSIFQGATGDIQINIFGVGVSTRNIKTGNFDSGKPLVPSFGSSSAGFEQNFNFGFGFVNKDFGQNLDSGTSKISFSQASTPTFGAASPAFRSESNSRSLKSNLEDEKNINGSEKFGKSDFGKSLLFNSSQITASKRDPSNTLFENVTDSGNFLFKNSKSSFNFSTSHVATDSKPAFANSFNKPGFLGSSKAPSSTNLISDSVGFGFKSFNSDDSKISGNTNTTLQLGGSNTKLFDSSSCLKSANTNAAFNFGDSNSKTKPFNSFKTSSSADVTLESKDTNSKAPAFSFSKNDDKMTTASKFGD